MNYMVALNRLIAHGVSSELIAATKTGESILVLTDGPVPAMGLLAHSAYAVSDHGIIEGSWLMQSDHVAVCWDAQPYEAMPVAVDKLHFNHTGLCGLNDRLEARLKALP